MKFSLAMGCLILSALSVISCGKKEQQSAPSETKNEKSIPSGTERLFDAWGELEKSVRENDTRSLRMVLFENPDLPLDHRLTDGDTLLTFSIKKRFPLIRNILLEKGADPNLNSLHRESSGQTPLILAALMGDVATIRALIALDVFLDSQDDLGDTALHKAILQGYDDLSFILIRAGSEITKRNTNDETPLDLATRLNRTAVRESLDGLESIDKKMPSSAVFKEILLNADVINYKRVIGLYPDILKNYESMNLLALAVASKSELRGFEISLSLIALKVSIDGPEGAETTPLIQAVKLKRKSFVELIIRSGPALDKTDRKDKPALHYAIENNDEGMVDLLVTSGAQEKFEILKNNRKVTFRGCRVADSQQRKLTTPEELAMNRKIQLRLGCRWTR